MILACVGIYAQNFTSKIAPSHDLITLRGINRNLALFSAFFTGAELLDTIIPHNLVVSVAEGTVGIRAGINVEEEHSCLLHFEKRACISQLTFRVMLNDRPTQRMIVVANRIHAQSDHVDGHPTKRERSITIPLKTPPAGNHTKNIEQKPWRGKVDVHKIP
jgi:hypothetical protein